MRYVKNDPFCGFDCINNSLKNLPQLVIVASIGDRHWSQMSNIIFDKRREAIKVLCSSIFCDENVHRQVRDKTRQRHTKVGRRVLTAVVEDVRCFKGGCRAKKSDGFHEEVLPFSNKTRFSRSIFWFIALDTLQLLLSASDNGVRKKV